MSQRTVTEGISGSLAPLRDVVESLDAARRGLAPSGNERRRLVRRVRAAGVACVPSLVRALASERPEQAAWACYLLARLGGSRVIERLSRLLEEPRTSLEARARAERLLRELHARTGIPVPGPVSWCGDDEEPSDAQVEQSVHSLLDSLATDDDLGQAVDLILRDIAEPDLAAFAAEIVRHGGDGAGPLLDALLASGRFEDGTRDELARLREQVGPAPAPRLGARDPRGLAFDRVEAGDFAAARALLEQVVGRSPDDAEALSFLGVSCLELDDPDAALPHLERAIALEPGEALHQWNLAAAARAGGQLCRSYFALTRYLELPDALPGARERRREGRRFQRAYERSIRRTHPGVPIAEILAGEHLFLRAFDALRAGRYEESIEGFEQVLALLPQHYPSWGNLGAAYFAIGRSVEAQRSLRRALELKPDYEVARENLRRLETGA